MYFDRRMGVVTHFPKRRSIQLARCLGVRFNLMVTGSGVMTIGCGFPSLIGRRSLTGGQVSRGQTIWTAPESTNTAPITEPGIPSQPVVPMAVEAIIRAKPEPATPPPESACRSGNFSPIFVVYHDAVLP